MVIACHVVFSTYGFWLPNDPRGSGSEIVRNRDLYTYGPATKVSTRRSVSRQPHNVPLRQLAKSMLRYPPVRFTGSQALCVANGFKRELIAYGGSIYACAIMRDHVHLVIGRHRYEMRRFVARLRGAATKELKAADLHPLKRFESNGQIPSPWSRLPRIVYLNTNEEVFGRIEYVESNPRKSNLPPQKWSFVVPFVPA